MAKRLQGKRELNKAMTEIFKPFGISKVFLASTYAYYFEDEKISFKLTENTFEDTAFINFVEQRFDYKIEHPFIFSMLHELGHHLNNEEIEGEIYEFCMREKDRIETAIQTAFDEDTLTILEEQYFNLPDEIMATAWAVDYAKRHPKKIKKMWRECEKAFHAFYEKNNITP